MMILFRIIKRIQSRSPSYYSQRFVNIFPLNRLYSFQTLLDFGSQGSTFGVLRQVSYELDGIQYGCALIVQKLLDVYEWAEF